MQLTAATFQEHGYLVGNSFNQALITRCYNDVVKGYINQILPDYVFKANESLDDVDVVDAVYILTYILLLRRNVVKTNSGSKTKNVAQSQNVQDSEIEQLTITANLYLDKLQCREDATADADIYDVSRIYNFNTLT